jgi:peroxiredoxin
LLGSALDLPGGQAGARRQGRGDIGISVDSPYAHKAFQEKLGIDTTLLADFEPKGAVAQAYGSYLDGLGFANRTLVLVDEDGTVAWAYESPSPGEFPGANLIFDALAS